MDTKKARPDGGTSEQAGQKAGIEQTTTSISNDSTVKPPGQLSIADYLGHDRETARTGRELCATLNLDNRTLRQQIERERRAWALIVADNANGYWLTDDPGEAQQFARSMRHRAREIVRTAAAIERAAGLL